MLTTFLISILLFMPFENREAFQNENQNSQYHFEYIRYETFGGGTKDVIKILPTNDPNQIKFYFESYRYMKKPKDVIIDRTTSNEHLFDLFFKALKNEVPTEYQKLTKRKLKTGRWEVWTLVKADEEIAIEDEFITATLSILMYHASEQLELTPEEKYPPLKEKVDGQEDDNR